MGKKKKRILMLIFFIIMFFIINYSSFDEELQKFIDESEAGVVGRIIDGDTVIVNNNSVRLLGINSPEKGEKYYNEAKNFTQNLILNKTVKIEYGKDKYDLYGRKLGFIFLGKKNTNIEIVRNGFANIYLLDDKLHEEELTNVWSECIIKNINLCEKSKDECADCIELKELDVKNQEIVFYNKCDFPCSLKDWRIKDEGRKKFIFPDFVLKAKKEIVVIVGNKTDDENILFWKKEEYVWTSTGDTLFLRDDEGKLVLWESY